MRYLKRGCWLQLFKFSAVLGSLWILFLLSQLKTGKSPAYILKYQWLVYTDEDESPEKVCNCSAILQGEKEALLQAKLLTITKDFQKVIQIPDEYYINATQDCRKFQKSRKYITFPLNKEEEDFPLAYSMVVHHKPIGKTKDPAPFNLPILSGNAYIVVNRGYVRSVFEDKRIQALIEWAKDTYSPDEFLWATIQRIPGVPGSTWPNRKFDMTDMNAIARMVKWQWHEGSEGSLQAVYPECKGHHVRSVCVYGAGDLQWLIEQHHLFANKFDADRDPIAIYCLEKYLRHKALTDLV
ncbi:unnamed protein product [Oreochromis niloticus]|nr:unnamed protein product [Mustela putorius furo]